MLCPHFFDWYSMWTQHTRIIHDVWRLLILSNEEKTNDYENFEKGMIYMKILKKRGGSREKGEEETKSMPHASVVIFSSPCHHLASVVCPLTFHILIFSSEIAKPIDLKFGTKHLWHVLYKYCSFRPDPLTHMAATYNSCFWLVDF